MLWGVGGCTIAEAKERLTHPEALAWMAYLRKRGSLNLGRRIESSTALTITTYLRAKGGKAEMFDFTPHEEQPAASVEDVMSVLSTSASRRS